MNKTAIIDFVDTARESLESLVRLRAYEYGVSDKGTEEDVRVVNGKVLSNEESNQRSALIRAIKSAEDDQGFAHGFGAVMEEAAYTWFNRFIALRFMEVNGYLPSHTRVFSDENGSFNPQILKEATVVSIDGIDRIKVSDYIQSHQTDSLFKYLVILQCNELAKPIPEMFERISDYSELLFPNGLLKKDSIIAKMVEDIPEDDWKDQVQIIGWMYQFYIAKKKDEVFASKEAVTKDTIAAVTQLFTPDWIVRYMAENSIGRIWMESYPDSSLENTMNYYVRDYEQSIETKKKIDAISYKDVDPKDIKVIEPCCGSGHILVYCFDILYKLYLEKGYSSRDIPSLILQNNLTGLDIDRRASQLASFSLIMKARSYDSGFFRRGVFPKVHEIEDSSSINVLDFQSDFERAGFSKQATDTANYLLLTFKNAKVIGSLLKVQKRDYENFISEVSEKISSVQTVSLFEQDFYSVALPKLIAIAKLASTLSKQYDVMITNPPYLEISAMKEEYKEYFRTNYPNSKTDMFSMFMDVDLIKPNGFMAMINMHSWLFLDSFEKIRNKMYSDFSFITCVHLGPHAFDAIGGEVVQTISFVVRRTKSDFLGKIYKLVDQKSCTEKENEFLRAKKENSFFLSRIKLYSLIPGHPFVYWISDKFFRLFSSYPSLANSFVSGGRNKTHNNEKYVRFWWEIEKTPRWKAYANGGDYRKWFGNVIDVVDWSPEAISEYASHGGLSNPKYSDKSGVCWSYVSGKNSAFRIKGEDEEFSSGSPTLFSLDGSIHYELLGFLNSCVANQMLSFINPTINTGNGYVLSMPYISDYPQKDRVCSLVQENIGLCKQDWDSFEVSADFKKHPLLVGLGNDGLVLADKFNEIKETWLQRFTLLKKNEEELNEIFINTYGLSGELEPEVGDNEVSVRLANKPRAIRSLLSYFVGLFMGRFSLDANGLAYAGGPWDSNKYKLVQPNTNGIEVINSDFFGDDSLDNKCVSLVRSLFGEANFENNLSFIAEALSGKGSPREIISSYFLSNFYPDHLKVFQKRPIYLLFDAGKRNSFKALVYIHRYSPDTLATLRTDFILPLLDRYSSRIDFLEKEASSSNGTESFKAKKELEKIKGQYQELSEFEPKIHHLADQRLVLDLSDGVKANHEKLPDVLAPLK